MASEIVDTYFKTLLDTVLDFDSSTRSDKEFVQEMKDILTLFVGETIDELQDGFVNGMQDVVIFCRENFKVLIEAATGPEMGMMIGMLGTNTIMDYITKSYASYKQRK